MNDQTSKRKRSKDDDKHLGYQRPPLIDLGNEFYVIDVLHQFLRVIDLLLRLFFKSLILSDKCVGNYNPVKHLCLKALSDFLEFKLKFRGFDEKMDKNQMLSLLMSMQGPTKKKFFELFNFSDFPPIIRYGINGSNVQDKDIRNNISDVFSAYWDIHFIIRDKFDTQPRNIYSQDYIESKCKLLLEKFLYIFNEQEITPYLHATCFHFADQYQSLNGKINLYSTEGLEKLNDFSTYQFFRATNKKTSAKSTYIKQILERDQRIEMYSNSVL
jgi:hypothetical protein